MNDNNHRIIDDTEIDEIEIEISSMLRDEIASLEEDGHSEDEINNFYVGVALKTTGWKALIKFLREKNQG